MRKNTTCFVCCAAGLLLLLALGTKLQAQPAAPARSANTATTSNSGTSNSSAPAGLLSQAYAALSSADHDYQGHRVRAMMQVKAAARELGVTLQGDGQGQEAQATSDQQLRTAQSLLQQALPSLHQRAKMHIEKAIQQLSMALSVN
jgi:pyruvate/2-oxoglutarate dehydrogenase complex dihydrolipoamide acyltransferase (E2) component